MDQAAAQRLHCGGTGGQIDLAHLGEPLRAQQQLLGDVLGRHADTGIPRRRITVASSASSAAGDRGISKKLAAPANVNILRNRRRVCNFPPA